MKDKVTAFFCGPKRDHECDSNGPTEYYLSDGTVTNDKSKAGKGCTGASVTCSICGMSSMEKSLWDGP